VRAEELRVAGWGVAGKWPASQPAKWPLVDADTPVQSCPDRSCFDAKRLRINRSLRVISIRRATGDDAQQIGVVFDAAVREGWAYLGELSRKPMFPPTEWDDLVKEHAPPNELLVAVNDSQQVVGFTAVHPAEGEMYLLFVHPEYAGRGVGRALLAAAHEALRVGGCREVFLYTHEQNERAIRVYEAAGYRRDGTVRESNFRGVHQREPRMVKRL
jgi:ribosomal protein S18 acetylase RimI-like enzyme